MSSLNLRVSEDELEIVSTLNKMFREKSIVLVWQNIDKSRTICNAKISDIDYSKGILFLSPMTKGTTFEFSKNYTFYIRGYEKSILFKASNGKMKNDKIVISIPKSVRMYEKRTTPRIKFGHDGNLTALLEKQVNNITKTIKEFEFKVYDISKEGISLIFPPREQIYFSKNDSFQITQIGKLRIESGIEASVVYVKKIEIIRNYNRVIRMKFGAKFKSALDENVISSLEQL